jgi:hypothetical protein
MNELAQDNIDNLYFEDKAKEYNIGLFKKGFCQSIHHYLEWRIDMTL